MDDFQTAEELTFVVDDVSNIVKESIENTIGGSSYIHNKVNQWNSNVVEQCLNQLTKLNKPFKYIVTCIIMQKNGAGLHTASSCYWDSNTDGSCTIRMAMQYKTKEETEQIFQYFRNHNVTEVLEAILTGLAVMRPEDSISYIEQSLEELKQMSYSEISWDMLIPDEMRPKQKVMLPSAMEFIFTNRRRDGDEDEVAPELYDKACHHYNDKILRMTFNAIRHFIQIKRDLEAEEARKLALAINFNRLHLCSVAFANWKSFADQRIAKTTGATEKMKVVFANYVQQVIFDSWYMSAVEAKKTREYFELEDAYEDEYSRIFRGVRGRSAKGSGNELREAKDKRSTVLSIRKEVK